MLTKILLVLFYLVFPVFVIWLGNSYSIIRRIGSIVICYIVGLIIGNIGLLPDDVYGLQDILTSITIPLAIPLLLFSENIKKVVSMAKKTFLSLILGIIAVIITIVGGYYLFRSYVPELWKISGMLTGCYTGGTPNLAAIAEMLHVDSETYILTHSTDLAVGAVVLLFLLTVAQKFFLLFMKPFKKPEGMENMDQITETTDEFESYTGITSRQIMFPLLKALGLSVLFFGIGGALSLLFSKYYQTMVVILTITSLGIAASLFPAVNNIRKTFPLGMYFILVFSTVVASMADVSTMFNKEESVFIAVIMSYIVMAVIGALLLHAILSWMFDVDADSFIITSVALSMSPPFVPVVAAALKNKVIVVPGIIIGIIGYAIGNYLGVAIAYALK